MVFTDYKWFCLPLLLPDNTAAPMMATVDNIVINEPLCFYITRMDVLPRSLLHWILLYNFTDTDVTSAKDVLHSHISVPLNTVESNTKVTTDRNTM